MPRRPYKVLWTLVAALAIALGLLSAAGAAEAVGVSWTVEPSNSYTIEDNGGQPVVTLNECIGTGEEVYIPFEVAVDAGDRYEARLTTVGEETMFLELEFEPATISGDDSQAFSVGVTITAKGQAQEDASRFGIYLASSTTSEVLGNSFLSVDVNCIVDAGDGDADVDGDNGHDGDGDGGTDDGNAGEDDSDNGDADDGEGDDGGEGDGRAGEGDGDGQTGVVARTFELTLYGDVPQGESFYVQYRWQGDAPDQTETLLFCGDLIGEEPKESCEGGGTTYSVTVHFDAGTVIDFKFSRHDVDDSYVDTFYSDTETMSESATNSAYFEYSNDGDGDPLPDLPDSGAGGVAPAGSRSREWFGALFVLVAGSGLSWRAGRGAGA